MVLISITTDPALMPSSTPPVPATTSSTSGESDTIVMTISDLPASSAGEPATAAPASASGAHFEAVLLKTVSG
jgi:hypothetical protein